LPRIVRLRAAPVLSGSGPSGVSETQIILTGVSAPDALPPPAASSAAATIPVSVVIPAYNRPEMVTRAVRSALRQTPYPPAEVIVVDDCSDDDTGTAAARAGARVIRHDVNRGEGAARNTGVAAATQAWVALLDSDDEWLPDLLATLWPLRGGYALVGGASLSCEEGRIGFGGHVGSRPLVLRSPRPLIYPENFVAASGTMVRRDIVRNVGGYVEGMKGGADMDLWIRVLEQGEGLIVPHPVVLYHRHSGQVTGDADMMAAAHRTVARSYAARAWWRPADLERWEGASHYDAARRDWRLHRRSRAARSLLGLVAHPQRFAGALGILVRRGRLRRRSGPVSAAGPTTAYLPGASPPLRSPAARDLTARSNAGALMSLAVRPAHAVVAGSRWQALIARCLGVRTARVEKRPAERRPSA
jgi:glycosyltransferase involved in cell wall biosynthesis